MRIVIDFLSSASAVDHLYLPFTVAVFIMALGRRGYPDEAPVFAIATGVITSFAVAVTPIMPLWPPVGMVGKLPYVIAGAAVLSFPLNGRQGARLAIPLGIAGTVATVMWIGHDMSDPLGRYPLWIALVVLVAAGTLASVQLELSRRIRGIGPLALLTASAVLVIAAMDYGSRMGLHSLALAGAVAGVVGAGALLGCRPWGRAETFVATMGFMAIATSLFFTRTQLALPVGLAFLAFFTGEIGRLARRYLALSDRAVAYAAAAAILTVAMINAL